MLILSWIDNLIASLSWPRQTTYIDRFKADDDDYYSMLVMMYLLCSSTYRVGDKHKS